MNKDIALAWAAGFFDGEGSVYSAVETKRNGCKNRAMRITVAQIHPGVLYRFQSAVGAGSVSKHRRTTSAGNPVYRLGISGYPSCMRVYCALKPYLSAVKLQQFEAAFAKYESFPLKRKKKP